MSKNNGAIPSLYYPDNDEIIESNVSGMSDDDSLVKQPQIVVDEDENDVEQREENEDRKQIDDSNNEQGGGGNGGGGGNENGSKQKIKNKSNKYETCEHIFYFDDCASINDFKTKEMIFDTNGKWNRGTKREMNKNNNRKPPSQDIGNREIQVTDVEFIGGFNGHKTSIGCTIDFGDHMPGVSTSAGYVDFVIPPTGGSYVIFDEKLDGFSDNVSIGSQKILSKYYKNSDGSTMTIAQVKGMMSKVPTEVTDPKTGEKLKGTNYYVPVTSPLLMMWYKLVKLKEQNRPLLGDLRQSAENEGNVIMPIETIEFLYKSLEQNELSETPFGRANELKIILSPTNKQSERYGDVKNHWCPSYEKDPTISEKTKKTMNEQHHAYGCRLKVKFCRLKDRKPNLT